MPRALNDTSSALTAQNLIALPERFGCPVWAYDGEIITQKINQLRHFDVIRFAQKACSNIHILRLMHEQGVKVDSVSLGEIERALQAGFQPGQHAPGHPVWLRVNPGFGHGHSQKTNTGGENSKHGIWHEDLPQAIEKIQQYGLTLVGIHMHIGSGVDYQHLEQVCDAMVQQVIALGQDISAISAGGGLSIPYQSGDDEIDTEHYYGLWNSARERIAAHLGHPVSLEIEPGRFLVAEAGVLIAQVRAVKNMGRRHYVLVDAGFNDLMRPAMYGSYHHISVLPADGRSLANEPLIDTVVAGPLCESGDVFTQEAGGGLETRKLPAANIGDYLVFHDTGAYGASMSSNYNSRPLLPEVLFEQGQPRLIRRRQTIEELIALELI
ncbi:TPA: diaminopimelate decarboxylase [Yersinia enterocolitica]